MVWPPTSSLPSRDWSSIWVRTTCLWRASGIHSISHSCTISNPDQQLQHWLQLCRGVSAATTVNPEDADCLYIMQKLCRVFRKTSIDDGDGCRIHKALVWHVSGTIWWPINCITLLKTNAVGSQKKSYRWYSSIFLLLLQCTNDTLDQSNGIRLSLCES